jgi:putative peptide zinc metalloprotease protein
MPVLDTYLPTTERRLSLRMRADLTAHPQRWGRRRVWVIKDGVTLRYFHLSDEEYGLLQLLDGQSSLDEIQTEFERRWAPRKLGLPQLQAFLVRLHQDGLVISEATGQGDILRQRAGKLRWTAWRQTLSNPLAIRFRGIDPDRFLDWLYPHVRVLFSPACVTLCLLAIVSAILLVTARFEMLTTRLPDFQVFFNPRNLVWLAATVAAVKVLHEMGHALACKHFGGECHELGVMLLLFTPCLYCNVSDAWLLPRKWQRIAISAAGMYVELVIAAIATWLWWFSEPGLLNSWCLDLMFVCSVSTVLFNGNPLLPYDGYFIFSDLVEVPNLRQEASSLLRGAVARWWLGIDNAEERRLSTGPRALLVLFGVASMAYRWFVLLAMLWFCHEVLRPYRLDILVQALGLTVIGGALVAPIWNLAEMIHDPRRSGQVKWRQALIRGGMFLSVVAVLMLMPLPYRLVVPVLLEPQGAARVYVSAPGKLLEPIPQGKVQKGQTLARLENAEIELEVVQLRGQRDQQSLHLRHLKSQSVQGAQAAAQLPAATQELADLEERLRQREADQQRLTLVSPTEGVVLPPPLQILRESSTGELPRWTGTPLDAHNRGSFLETGTLVCSIGDPNRLEAMLAIDQTEIEAVRVGQRVRIQLDQSISGDLWGAITEIAKVDLKVAPRELNGQELPTRRDEFGISRPVRPTYQARVELDAHEQILLNGAAGRAKIYAEPRSLARRLYRYVLNTFRFEL